MSEIIAAPVLLDPVKDCGCGATCTCGSDCPCCREGQCASHQPDDCAVD